MKQKNYTSAFERRWQKRFQRIQRRKDEELLRQDSEVPDCELVDFEHQLATYRAMMEEDRHRRDLERHMEEMNEAFQRFIDERIWHEFRRAASEYQSGFRSANVFVDEFVESPEEELDDLEAGETCFLDEFIGSFQ